MTIPDKFNPAIAPGDLVDQECEYAALERELVGQGYTDLVVVKDKRYKKGNTK